MVPARSVHTAEHVQPPNEMPGPCGEALLARQQQMESFLAQLRSEGRTSGRSERRRGPSLIAGRCLLIDATEIDVDARPPSRDRRWRGFEVS